MLHAHVTVQEVEITNKHTRVVFLFSLISEGSPSNCLLAIKIMGIGSFSEFSSQQMPGAYELEQKLLYIYFPLSNLSEQISDDVHYFSVIQ